MSEFSWTPRSGRELDSSLQFEPPRLHKRITACVNVWNDVEALRMTVPTWLPFVDRIIAVDGAYDVSGGLSSDGSRELLKALNKDIIIYDAVGASQCEKRTMYLRAAPLGEYLLIIDADEQLYNPHVLRDIPACDVGWVRVNSPLYTREYGQPRIIRNIPNLEYRGRHHWIYQGEKLVCTHQYGGVGYEHRVVPLEIYNHRHRVGDNTLERSQAVRRHRRTQREHEHSLISCPAAEMSDRTTKLREALHICQRSYRDDGLAPSRLHSAINRTTPHASLFFKQRPGPYNAPEQFLIQESLPLYERAKATCDILHFHSQISVARGLHSPAGFVFHHHGTMLRNNADDYNRDALNAGALVLVSNLELLSWVEGDAQYLPNAVPVARYQHLRMLFGLPFTGNNTFRIAHSPSQPEKKGTAILIQVVERLKAKGVPIEIIHIQDCSHATALRLKASCHACFDSFWLGIQCSGIEAAAMGMPVVAGDDVVRRRYQDLYNYVPYTFADDAESLEHTLFRLVDDASYRESETRRVTQHIETYHDESAVALQYLDFLDLAFHWRSTPFHQRTRRMLHAH